MNLTDDQLMTYRKIVESVYPNTVGADSGSLKETWVIIPNMYGVMGYYVGMKISNLSDDLRLAHRKWFATKAKAEQYLLLKQLA